MHRTVRDAIMFISGAAIGYFVTRKLLEKRYEERYQEDVKSTKEAYAKRSSPILPKKEHTDNIIPSDKLPDIKEYSALLREEQYFDYSGISKTETEGEEKEQNAAVERPYVISPDEFGEFEDYETISLTYYADGKLADEENELVDDVDEIVGEDSLTQFGIYEDDSVHVRNDAKKCDYEILMDHRNYFDVIKNKPHRSVEA